MIEQLFKTNGVWSNNAIFLAKAGSQAYGTTTPNSDIDYRGVFMSMPSNLIGIDTKIESHVETEPYDTVMYELNHFVRLCCKGSPGQVEMLFYPEDVIVKTTPYWDQLTKIKNSFLSKKLRFTLGGFAQSDIKKIMNNHTNKCGAKGKEMIAKFGYNTKHAANAYRMLWMAHELFSTNQLVVRLPEAVSQLARDIKNGCFSKDDFLSFIHSLDQQVADVFQKTNLPENIDFVTINRTMINLNLNWLILKTDEEHKINMIKQCQNL